MKHNYFKQLFIALLLLCGTVAHAYDFTVDGIYYTITDETAKTVEVTSGDTNYSGNIVIPESVNYNEETYNVTSIRSWTFYNLRRITSIIIPNSVTNIGYSAFNGCKGLTSVTIGNSVTNIGEYALSDCKGLTSITIPNSVTTIEGKAFSGCTGLAAVHINDLSAWCNIDFSDSGSNPLSYARNLYLNGELVTDLVIPNDVTKIKQYAFYKCTGLTSITIPNSVTTIGNQAFYNCTGLTSVTIPNSVTSIGDYAFEGCTGLASVTIPNSVTSIGDYAFKNCIAFEKIIIPQKVESIGVAAFAYCISLKNIEIPNSVKHIGDLAFWRCFKLDSVAIPQKVKRIGHGAFYNCSALTNVEIPNSVKSIDDFAFTNCTGLKSVTIGYGVTTIGDYAFDNCYKLKIVYNNSSLNITKGSEEHGYVAYYAVVVITEEHANEYKNIDDFIFHVTDSVNTLVAYTGNDSVITLPENCNDENYVIGDKAFYNCTGLTSITIPNSVTSIGNSAFEGCSRLTSITIPNSMTSIGNQAFKNCTGVTSVIIGTGVKTIGEQAFYWCFNITEIYSLSETPATINTYTFSYSATLYVPIGAKEAYQAAEYWKNFTNIVEMDMTGIEDIKPDESYNGLPDTYYDMQGRIVEEPSHGIYIYNGVKVLVK